VRTLIARELEAVAPTRMRTRYSVCGAWAFIDCGSVTIEVSYEMEFRDGVYVAAWPCDDSVEGDRPESATILGDSGLDAFNIEERRRFFAWLGRRLAMDLPEVLASRSGLGQLAGLGTAYTGWKRELHP